MTTEPRTESRTGRQSEPDPAWLRAEEKPARQAAEDPAGQARRAVSSGRHRRAPEERSSYREVFAIGEFRAIWSAQVLSYAGDQFAQVAIAILIYGRTHSPFLTALAYALTYLPPIAGGPLLSGLADLFPRRRVMIACDLLRVGTVGLMAIPGMPFGALCVLLSAPCWPARRFRRREPPCCLTYCPAISSCSVPRSAISPTRRARFWGSSRARRLSACCAPARPWA